MKSLKEAGQRIEKLATEAAQYYSRVDRLEDEVLRALAHTKWTPAIVAAAFVAGFYLCHFLT